MAKEKETPIKEKLEEKPEEVVEEKVDEVIEKVIPKKKTPTVKERIDTTIDKYHEDKDELKKQVFQLVQRVLYPEQFCPNCDERMFFNSDTVTYKCPNCDYSTTVTMHNATATPARPSTLRATPGKVPEQVEKAIEDSEKAMRESGVPVRATKLGDKIRKLVDERDAGGPVAPTAIDEARVKGSSRNVASKINWV